MSSGDSPCPNCGFAYNDHGLGGNCPVLKVRKKKEKK